MNVIRKIYEEFKKTNPIILCVVGAVVLVGVIVAAQYYNQLGIEIFKKDIEVDVSSNVCTVEKISQDADFLSKEFFKNQLFILKSRVATVSNNVLVSVFPYISESMQVYVIRVRKFIITSLCDNEYTINKAECENLNRGYDYNQWFPQGRCGNYCLDTDKFINSYGKCVECQEGTFPLRVAVPNVYFKEDREIMTCSTFDESKCHGGQIQVENAVGKLLCRKPECHIGCILSDDKKCINDTTSCPNGTALVDIKKGFMRCQSKPDKSSCPELDDFFKHNENNIIFECRGKCPEGTYIEDAICVGPYKYEFCEQFPPVLYVHT